MVHQPPERDPLAFLSESKGPTVDSMVPELKTPGDSFSVVALALAFFAFLPIVGWFCLLASVVVLLCVFDTRGDAKRKASRKMSKKGVVMASVAWLINIGTVSLFFWNMYRISVMNAHLNDLLRHLH
jgi:hypothetical protein